MINYDKDAKRMRRERCEQDDGEQGKRLIAYGENSP